MLITSLFALPTKLTSRHSSNHIGVGKSSLAILQTGTWFHYLEWVVRTMRSAARWQSAEIVRWWRKVWPRFALRYGIRWYTPTHGGSICSHWCQCQTNHNEWPHSGPHQHRLKNAFYTVASSNHQSVHTDLPPLFLLFSTPKKNSKKEFQNTMNLNIFPLSVTNKLFMIRTAKNHPVLQRKIRNNKGR